MNYQLLEILACPICKGKLRLTSQKLELICKLDRLAYPIVDGIPILMEDRARPLSDQEVHDGI